MFNFRYSNCAWILSLCTRACAHIHIHAAWMRLNTTIDNCVWCVNTSSWTRHTHSAYADTGDTAVSNKIVSYKRWCVCVRVIIFKTQLFYRQMNVLPATEPSRTISAQSMNHMCVFCCCFVVVESNGIAVLHPHHRECTRDTVMDISILYAGNIIVA